MLPPAVSGKESIIHAVGVSETLPTGSLRVEARQPGITDK
jgi:hypothetical protein